MTRWARLALAAAVLCVLVAGCKEKPYLKFKHDVHAQIVEDLTCDNCHALKKGKYLLPSHENCADCHEEASGEPNQKCLLCHYKPDPKAPKRAFTRPYEDLKFDHAKHSDKDCSYCHPSAEERFSLPKMEQCFECHTDLEARANCRACHSVIAKDVRPTTHNLAFMRNHSSGDTSRCSLCHGQNSCDDCHHNERPSFHTAGWDKDFHGKEALRDRRRCAFCHEGSFCDRCHSEKPYYHYGTNFKFGHADVAKRNRRSCLVCHKPEMCTECHKDKGFFPYGR